MREKRNAIEMESYREIEGPVYKAVHLSSRCVEVADINNQPWQFPGSKIFLYFVFGRSQSKLKWHNLKLGCRD